MADRIPLSCFSASQERFDNGSTVLRVETGPHDVQLVISPDGAASIGSYRVRGPEECDRWQRIKEVADKARAASEIPSESAEKPLQSMWKRAGEFARAVGSRAVEGHVSLAVLDHRHQCCHGTTIDGETVSSPCPARKENGRGVFCKSCGCPEWKLADISVDPERPYLSKLAFPALECPKHRFSSVRGVRAHAAI